METENTTEQTKKRKTRTVHMGFEKVINAPEDTLLPTKGSKESACYDIYAPCRIVIPPHSATKLVFTNIKAYMPSGWKFQLFIRSSMGVKKCLSLETSGVIDKDYYGNSSNDGNIGVKLRNNGNKWEIINKGDRFVQGDFEQIGKADNDSYIFEERQGGHGSSGK